MKLFLLALAIVDDIGAILVIAIVYSDGLDLDALLISLVLFGRSSVAEPAACAT